MPTASELARSAVASNGGSAQQQAAGAQAAAMAHQILTGQSGLSDQQAALTLATVQTQHPVAFAAAMVMFAEGSSAKWEAGGGELNPISGIKRRRPYPVKLLPATTVLSNGTGLLTFTPQEEFEAFRLVVPSGQAGGPYTFSQLQAGDRLMFAQSGRVPGACLSEKSDLGRIDFPTLKLGETVTMAVQQVTPSGTPEVDAILFGYAKGKPRKLPDGASIVASRVEPFDVVNIAALGTGAIVLTPQRNIICRRIGLDDTVANFSNLYVTSINVQDDPQYVGSAEIPAEIFSQLAVDDWLDFDLCQLGGVITINLKNTHATLAVTAQGMAVSDVVRLQSDAR